MIKLKFLISKGRRTKETHWYRYKIQSGSFGCNFLAVWRRVMNFCFISLLGECLSLSSDSLFFSFLFFFFFSLDLWSFFNFGSEKIKHNNIIHKLCSYKNTNNYYIHKLTLWKLIPRLVMIKKFYKNSNFYNRLKFLSQTSWTNERLVQERPWSDFRKISFLQHKNNQQTMTYMIQLSKWILNSSRIVQHYLKIKNILKVIQKKSWIGQLVVLASPLR